MSTRTVLLPRCAVYVQERELIKMKFDAATQSWLTEEGWEEEYGDRTEDDVAEEFGYPDAQVEEKS